MPKSLRFLPFHNGLNPSSFFSSAPRAVVARQPANSRNTRPFCKGLIVGLHLEKDAASARDGAIPSLALRACTGWSLSLAFVRRGWWRDNRRRAGTPGRAASISLLVYVGEQDAASAGDGTVPVI